MFYVIVSDVTDCAVGAAELAEAVDDADARLAGFHVRVFRELTRELMVARALMERDHLVRCAVDQCDAPEEEREEARVSELASYAAYHALRDAA